MYRISKRWMFDAAHYLGHLSRGHKCRELHGHTYTVEVELSADDLGDDFFVRDYGELEDLVGYWIKENLDHECLNRVMPEGVPPTAECIAKMVWDRFREEIPELKAVRVSETPNTWAEYRP